MDITTLIGSYGFPIVACVAMAWYVKYITDANRADVATMCGKWEETLKEVTESIKNNTNVMTRLCERMGEHENVNEDC